MGAVLTLTSPGIPMIFEGQEFLEDGAWHDDDPLDWAKAVTHAGILLLYRDLIALRRNRRHTTAGLPPNVTVHHVGVPRAGRWHVRFNSDWRGYDPGYGDHPSFAADTRPQGRDGMPFNVTAGLGPYSAVILSQDG